MDYEDTTKVTQDFFSKPFPANNLVKIATETGSNNLSLKTTSSRLFVTDKKTKEVSELYETVVEPKYDFKDIGVAVELKLTTQNTQKIVVTKSEVTKGLKFSVGATQEGRDNVRQTINVGAEYKHPQVFIKANAGVPLDSRPIPVSGNVVFQPVDNVFVGAKFDLKYQSGEKGQLEKEVEFKVAGASGATRGYITTTLDRKLNFSVNHLLEKEVVGLKVTVEAPTEGSVKLGVDAAASYKYNSTTAFSGKLGVTPALGDESKKTGIRFGLGSTYQFGNATATASGDLNVGQFLGNGGAAHSFGFELKLK